MPVEKPVKTDRRRYLCEKWAIMLLAKLCRAAVKEDLKERRAEVSVEAAEAGFSIRNARRNFANFKTKVTALRRPDGTVTSSRRTMEKPLPPAPCHLPQDGYVVPSVLPSEIRHAISSVKKRTAPGPAWIRPEHPKNLLPTLINALALLSTRYLSGCKKKGDVRDIGNYRPICLLSVVYKLFTRVILNRISRMLDEGQLCEQAGFRKGFCAIDTITKFSEVSRELIELKKVFDSVETEALYSGFTTKISPFYNDVVVDVKRAVRQGDTISPKLFSATLENVMRELEWEDMGVRVDGQQLHHLRFADDIVLMTASISQAERMLADFDCVCGNVGLQLNLTKLMFMRNGQVCDAPFSLNGTNISECSSYRRKRAAWGAFKSVEEVMKLSKNRNVR
ncbi:unnamed protein product [Heligmosomoides polygyrus]|uniref:Reverse transcriptase domain-containing protein n=1 Tax=Heligmosomoides polygyrus TaxID=6339 RepID=A0A183FIL9_HELPZ|nr:unnamed protein product [Heligmosomoides polygyrus]